MAKRTYFLTNSQLTENQHKIKIIISRKLVNIHNSNFIYYVNLITNQLLKINEIHLVQKNYLTGEECYDIVKDCGVILRLYYFPKYNSWAINHKTSIRVNKIIDESRNIIIQETELKNLEDVWIKLKLVIYSSYILGNCELFDIFFKEISEMITITTPKQNISFLINYLEQ